MLILFIEWIVFSYNCLASYLITEILFRCIKRHMDVHTDDGATTLTDAWRTLYKNVLFKCTPWMHDRRCYNNALFRCTCVGTVLWQSVSLKPKLNKPHIIYMGNVSNQWKRTECPFYRPNDSLITALARAGV